MISFLVDIDPTFTQILNTFKIKSYTQLFITVKL